MEVRRITTTGGGAFFLNSFMPHFPTPKQIAALIACESGQRVLYGGAAGGGKTDCLLMAALQYIHIPGYKAVVIRRTYPQLAGEDGVMARAKQWGWASKGATWSERHSMWTFPSGAVIAFKHLDLQKHADDYQGKEYHFVGLDEVTQWADENLALYPATRLRRSKAVAQAGVRLRFLATANPGGPGHGWVRQRWVDPVTRQKGHQYIPARMEDNPHLDHAEYQRVLRSQGAVTYNRLARGDWSIIEGGLFAKAKWVVVSRAPAETRWVHSIDLASSKKQKSDFSASGYIGLGPDGILYIRDLKMWKELWPRTRAILKQRILNDPATVLIEAIGGFQVAASDLQHDPDLMGVIIRPIKHKGDKVSMAGPWAAWAEDERVALVAGDWLKDFTDQASTFPLSKHDDMIDVVSQGYTFLATPQGKATLGKPSTAFQNPDRLRASY
jgi:predicted phage terminase large subunit-like protein